MASSQPGSSNRERGPGSVLIHTYLILDARYERVREAGVILSQAVLIAISIDWDGGRQVLAASLPLARAARAGGIFC